MCPYRTSHEEIADQRHEVGSGCMLFGVKYATQVHIYGVKFSARRGVK